ncbi:MAG: branched-chain amino acid ABC transporter permease [Rhodospirillaceae bacterium TMED167]|nr:branched-chain amino acid ABC transporter permease [Rhodospirillaceae bacterium]OUW26935.1 MAG: branched-chain amino acid ABC transporter permease [Rhodospirillaceae bacterium TMED167]
MEILIGGILLGGTYALIAMGLQLQYGVAKIMNLANGEILVAGSFGALWLFTGAHVNPILAIVVLAPAAYILNYAIYQLLLRPLVTRAKSEGQLEVDSILSTFGISFIFVGLLHAIFGGEYFNYEYLEIPFEIFNQAYGINRIIAFVGAAILALLLYIWLSRTRSGLKLRAVSVNPESAKLVGIDVARASALAFSLGGAVTAAGGSLISMFDTFDASLGVVYTMKALIIVIMGGVKEIKGTIVAAFILGLAETAVATLIDPGLTLAAAFLLFILILLFRPQGLFGRPSS